MSHRLSNKNLSVWNENPPSESLNRGILETSKIIQAFVISPIFLQEQACRTLLLMTLYTSYTGLKRLKRITTVSYLCEH